MSNTQTNAILLHLKEHKDSGITSMQAFELYGATRLSAIIYNLKLRGYGIETVVEETKNRYGSLTRYGRYFLISEPKED